MSWKVIRIIGFPLRLRPLLKLNTSEWVFVFARSTLELLVIATERT